MFRFLLLTALMSVLALPAFSEPPAKAQPKATAAEIERLIKQLGSDDFAQREAASKALEEIGEPALEALSQADIGADVEAKRRARELARVIESRLYTEVRCLRGHKAEVVCVAFSPDGRQLLSAGRDSTLRLWDVTSGKKLRCLGRTCVHQAAFSPDGRRALTGAAGYDATDTIFLCDLVTGEELRGFRLGQKADVQSLAFSPDGKRVLSGGGDSLVRLWDADSRRELRRFVGHDGSVLAVAFSPDGKQALSAGVDGEARLWDLATGKQLRRLRGQNRSVLGVAFAPNGRYIATCGTDAVGAVRLLDVERGREVRRFGSAGGIECVAFSPDGRRVLSGSGRGDLCLWDAETGKIIACWQGHEGDLLCVAFSPDGRLAASGGEDHTVRLWRLPKRRKVSGT